MISFRSSKIAILTGHDSKLVAKKMFEHLKEWLHFRFSCYQEAEKHQHKTFSGPSFIWISFKVQFLKKLDICFRIFHWLLLSLNIPWFLRRLSMALVSKLIQAFEGSWALCAWIIKWVLLEESYTLVTWRNQEWMKHFSRTCHDNFEN